MGQFLQPFDPGGTASDWNFRSAQPISPFFPMLWLAGGKSQRMECGDH